MKDLLDLKDLTIQREGVPTVDTGAVGPVDCTDCTTLKTSVPLPSHPRNGPPPSPPPATKTPFPWLAGGAAGGEAERWGVRLVAPPPSCSAHKAF